MDRQPAGAGPEPTGTDHEHEQHHETQPPNTPRIYIASLSDYNAGVLHGSWIDADHDLDDIHDSVKAILAKSPTDPGAEEFAIHDYEGFGPLRVDEYDSLGWITSVAQGITEHGPAYAAWADQCVRDQERLDHFEDAYLGEWQSLTAYAEDLLDDLGLDETIERAVPESLQPYVRIDYEGFARDLELSGDLTSVDSTEGSVWVFALDV
jgi:antirestriction protein